MIEDLTDIPVLTSVLTSVADCLVIESVLFIEVLSIEKHFIKQ